MLCNVSYNNSDIKESIDELVGKSFSFRERLKLGGTGSPKLKIQEASVEISSLLNLENSINYCNIELRPRGIIVSFRSILETYAWVVPYYRLSTFKSHDTWSFYSGEEHLKLRNSLGFSSVSDFFIKMQNLKSESYTDITSV